MRVSINHEEKKDWKEYINLLGNTKNIRVKHRTVFPYQFFEYHMTEVITINENSPEFNTKNSTARGARCCGMACPQSILGLGRNFEPRPPENCEFSVLFISGTTIYIKAYIQAIDMDTKIAGPCSVHVKWPLVLHTLMKKLFNIIITIYIFLKN